MIELKENGSQTPVTLENRKEYVQLSAQYRLYNSISKQIESLLSGFYEIIPKDLIQIVSAYHSMHGRRLMSLACLIV